MLAYALRYFTRAFWAFPVPSSGQTYGLQPPPILPPNPKRGHPMASIVAVFLFLLCLVLSNCSEAVK